MDYLFKLKEVAVEFLSPAAKRRRTIMPMTPAGEMQRPIRPEIATEPRNQKHKAIIAGRVNKKYLSPSDTKRSTRRRRHIDNDYVDEPESDTENPHALITPEDSASHIKSRSESISAGEDDEDERDLDLNSKEESELSAEAKVHLFLDRQTELARRQETIDRKREGNWHEDEILLFQKLSMRGFEPLLPSHWNYDFRTCPSTIFSRHENETFINSKSGNDFRATTALQSLVTLGGRVRRLMDVRKAQERCIKKELESYVKWSEKDGGFDTKRFLPLLVAVAGHPKQPLPALSKEITDQLEFLAIRHRQALALPTNAVATGMSEVQMFSRPPPVLYGVIISHCITVFVSLDSSKQDAKVKTIAHFDFSDSDMDVWNGFALAILVCMVRNHLMERKDEMEDESEAEETDPDL